ncbi:MAG: NADH-quinone oxidoreductase subunit N, partial [Anaerolineae bacterium]|nr:NADH-quinone oxidoreductase subunit N [Anaerolineae bacterium]
YLLAYMFTNLGAFGVALAIEKNDGSDTQIDNFTGLAKSQPMLALMMAVFMLSLAGIPLTGGFIGKWFVFKSALDAGLVPIAIIGVLTSVISAYYYVRVIVNMYLKDGNGDPAAGATRYVQWAVYIAFAGTLLMGILPWIATNLSDTVALAAEFLVK